MKSLKESLKESFEILLDANMANPPAGITTGFPGFDSMMRGMDKGTLTILGSRPSIGKTAFVLNIINNLIKNKSGTRILFCSDLSNTELTFRLLAIASGIKKHRGMEQNAEDVQRMTSSVEILRDFPLFFTEYCGMDEMFCSEIKTLCTENKFDFLIVDNIRPEDCRKLRMLAKELDIAILASVSFHSKKDEIFSKGIADTFVILHRERKVDYDPDLGAPVELIIAKNKHGICGTHLMYFLPQRMLFKENEPEDEPFTQLREDS